MPIGEFVVNNWPLFLALVIISYMLVRTYFGPGALANIRPAEAIQLINHQDAVVVDVRSDKEYQEGHIVNAVHIPLSVLEKRISDIKDYKSSPMIVVCRSGSRSASAVSILKKEGFEAAKNLNGGMLAWGSANLPVTTARSKKPVKNPKKKVRPIENNNLNEVVVYVTHRCPFCTRAINLLESKGVGYTEIDIGGKPELRKEMEDRAQRTSVPQIFIGDVHVGGCDDMYALEDEGKLDVLLGLNA